MQQHPIFRVQQPRVVDILSRKFAKTLSCVETPAKDRPLVIDIVNSLNFAPKTYNILRPPRGRRRAGVPRPPPIRRIRHYAALDPRKHISYIYSRLSNTLKNRIKNSGPKLFQKSILKCARALAIRKFSSNKLLNTFANNNIITNHLSKAQAMSKKLAYLPNAINTKYFNYDPRFQRRKPGYYIKRTQNRQQALAYDLNQAPIAWNHSNRFNNIPNKVLVDASNNLLGPRRPLTREQERAAYRMSQMLQNPRLFIRQPQNPDQIPRAQQNQAHLPVAPRRNNFIPMQLQEDEADERMFRDLHLI